MSNLILLVACFAIGIVLKRVPSIPHPIAPVLNAMVINVSLPALTILYVRRIVLDWSLIAPITMAWLFFLLGYLFFRFVGQALGWPRTVIGALMMTGGLGNTSFVGLPMIEAFYGKDALWIGLLADQAGSFFVLSTIGLAVAVRYGAGEFSVRSMLRKIVLFPPFVSMLVGIALMSVEIPSWMAASLDRLGQMLVPMALISVGYSLRLEGLQHHGRELTIGLVFKLVAAPAALLAIYSLLQPLSDTVLQVTIFEAAMPPMITGAIIAQQHGLDKSLTTLMVGIGIPLSMLTLPVWWWILQS